MQSDSQTSEWYSYFENALAAGANCRFSQIYYGLEHVGLAAGETLLIQGAGSMGLYAAAEPCMIIQN